MYLLDTNVCIEMINGRRMDVGIRFAHEAEAGREMFVSSISSFELWYGAAKSGRPEFNRTRLETFFNGPVQTLHFSEEDSVRAGELRAFLEGRGTPIGPYDLLIAGQALARGLVLVTHNVGEFRRVQGLKVEDWQA